MKVTELIRFALRSPTKRALAAGMTQSGAAVLAQLASNDERVICATVERDNAQANTWAVLVEVQ